MCTNMNSPSCVHLPHMIFTFSSHFSQKNMFTSPHDVPPPCRQEENYIVELESFAEGCMVLWVRITLVRSTPGNY